jgi:hypothetical protein
MRLNTIKKKENGRKNKKIKKEHINETEIWKENRRKYEEENRKIL